MTIKTYNVGRVDEYGLEIIQLYPPLTMREARQVRVKMQRTFKDNKYVVFNVATILSEEK